MMPYRDDTDRHCPHCHGKRLFIDDHPGQPSVTWCICVPRDAAPDDIPSKDALMDAAIASLAAAEGMTATAYRARAFAEHWGRE